jgi:hypothetical protein
MQKPMYEYLRNVRDSASEGNFGKGYAGYEKLSAGVQRLMDNYELMYDQRTLFGTPEKLIARITDARAAGLTEVSLITLMPSLSPADAMRSLRLINDEVAPAFRAYD